MRNGIDSLKWNKNLFYTYLGYGIILLTKERRLFIIEFFNCW
jgi:hypothetical protein